MKILFHGDHIEKSREEYIRLKTSFSSKEIREVNGKGIDVANLIQAIQSDSLFANGSIVCIEQLFGPLGRKVKQASVYATMLNEADPSSTILLWEQKELGKDILTLLGSDITPRLFSYPKIIFTFLDSLKPHNAKQSLLLLEELLLNEASELAWSMIITRVRTLIEIKDNVPLDHMSSWQKNRLTNQARLFTMERLLTMHTTLLTMEYALKNGSSPYALSDDIKQFIVSI